MKKYITTTKERWINGILVENSKKTEVVFEPSIHMSLNGTELYGWKKTAAIFCLALAFVFAPILLGAFWLGNWPAKNAQA